MQPRDTTCVWDSSGRGNDAATQDKCFRKEKDVAGQTFAVIQLKVGTGYTGSAIKQDVFFPI